MQPITIGVGSKNAAKLRSVVLAGERLWPGRHVIVLGADVPSGVRPQPMTQSETQIGARNRSQAVWQALPEVDYTVGLEGGLEHDSGTGWWFECGWCVVLDRAGAMGVGSTARSPISLKLVDRLKAGEELGDVVEDLTHRANVRQDEGYMGIITNGGLPRDRCYAHAVLFAFARFVSDPIFWNGDRLQ